MPRTSMHSYQQVSGVKNALLGRTHAPGISYLDVPVHEGHVPLKRPVRALTCTLCTCHC